MHCRHFLRGPSGAIGSSSSRTCNDLKVYVLGEAVLLEGAVGRAENNPMLQTLQAGTHNIIRGPVRGPYSSLLLNLEGGHVGGLMGRYLTLF